MDRHLHLHIKSSVLLQRYLLCLLLLAWIAIAVCGLPVWAKWLLAIAACVWVFHSIGNARYPVISGLLLDEGDWQLQTVSGKQPAQLCADSVVTYSITALHFITAAGAHERVLLLPDSSNAENLRRLRVLLLNPS
jgi:hypothetical protein